MNSIVKHFLSLILLSISLLILSYLFVACDDASTTTTNSQVATTLLSQAAPLCEKGQKASASSENLSPGKPVIFLASKGQAGKWSEFFTKSSTIPASYTDLQATTAETVKGVVCVLETSVVVGTYVPLSPATSASTTGGDDKAYRQDLEVWLVSYPAGKVIARNSFKGSDPALKIGGATSHYGQRPDKDMLEWLKLQLK